MMGKVDIVIDIHADSSGQNCRIMASEGDPRQQRRANLWLDKRLGIDNNISLLF